MKLLRIGAIWCSACLVMTKVISKIIDDYNIDYEELDLDMDEEKASNYNPGHVLPLFIVLDNGNEITRFAGEFSYEELKEKLKGAGIINEEV